MGRNSKEKRDRKKRDEDARRAERKRVREERTRIAPLTTLLRERTDYADAWACTAQHFDAAGHYDWMASRVSGHTRVLEIGTGDGRGTIALARAGHCVVSIDENPACLDAAEHNLRAAGIVAQRVKRETVAVVSGGHRITYGPLAAEPLRETVVLVEADVLNDPALWAWAQASRFDAVTCWLIGAHVARAENEALWERRISNSGDYRLHVQNGVYEMADVVLTSGGVLQVVDRRERLASAMLREDCIAGHREQAARTTLQVDDSSLQERIYDEPTGGVQMVVTRGASGREPDLRQLALVSIIARKP